jgi:hypothetical protein
MNYNFNQSFKQVVRTNAFITILFNSNQYLVLTISCGFVSGAVVLFICCQLIKPEIVYLNFHLCFVLLRYSHDISLFQQLEANVEMILAARPFILKKVF